MINIEPCCGRTLHCGARTMNATNVIEGFSVRPGLFLTNGAVVVPGGVSFTIHSVGATSCELCPDSAVQSRSPMPCCRFPSSSASAIRGR